MREENTEMREVAAKHSTQTAASRCGDEAGRRPLTDGGGLTSQRKGTVGLDVVVDCLKRQLTDHISLCLSPLLVFLCSSLQSVSPPEYLLFCALHWRQMQKWCLGRRRLGLEVPRPRCVSEGSPAAWEEASRPAGGRRLAGSYWPP